jgi:hypothetical protein
MTRGRSAAFATVIPYTPDLARRRVFRSTRFSRHIGDAIDALHPALNDGGVP